MMTMKGALAVLSLTVFMMALVTGKWIEGLDENVLKFAVGKIAAQRKAELKELTVAEENESLFKLLMSHNGEIGSSRLGTYKFKDCSDPKQEQLSVKKLEVSPDPLSFPGTFYVDFEGTFKETLDTPLAASVVIERRIGSTWIKIPCLGTIGSCHYDDVCDLLKGAVCPAPFVENKVPCKCPFVKGTYTLPNAAFEVDAAVFPSGDYHATGNLTMSGGFVGCIELWASFD